MEAFIPQTRQYWYHTEHEWDSACKEVSALLGFLMFYSAVLAQTVHFCGQIALDTIAAEPHFFIFFMIDPTVFKDTHTLTWKFSCILPPIGIFQ